MTENSEIFKEDMEWICKADLPWEKLRDSTVLVTGGTGLIGMTVINALIRAGRERGLGLDVCAVVRDTEKAHLLRERQAYWRKRESEAQRAFYFFPAWKLSEKSTRKKRWMKELSGRSILEKQEAVILKVRECARCSALHMQLNTDFPQ